jgi:hypothetical protein
MTDLRQRTEPIRSKKYRDGAKGAPCTLRIVGVCCGDSETTVFAHIRDRHTGKAQKASDLSGADACWRCHDVLDRRAKMPDGKYISDEDWHRYALRGIQETQERRHALGTLIVPLDPQALSTERKVKPRKPKAERAKIAQRANPWPPKGSRKIVNAPLARQRRDG